MLDEVFYLWRSFVALRGKFRPLARFGPPAANAGKFPVTTVAETIKYFQDVAKGAG